MIHRTRSNPRHYAHNREHWTKVRGKWRPKRAYNSIEEAYAFISKNHLYGEYQVYCCSVCGKYHLGSCSSKYTSNVCPDHYVYQVTLGDRQHPDYVYIGSHYGISLDPLYHGSCLFNKNQGECKWDRTTCSTWWRDTCLDYINVNQYTIEIICVYNSKQTENVEKECILAACREYGVVAVHRWNYKFKSGCVLNCQLPGGVIQLFTPEARKKVVETNRKNGFVSLHKAMCASLSKEAKLKMADTMRELNKSPERQQLF